MAEENCKIKPPNRLAGDEGFKDKTLLITGATGFCGKVLLEKMLRTCPLVKRIYITVRSKKGMNSQARLKPLFNNALFDLLKKTRGEKIFEKVIAIDGDFTEVGLGMSPENRKKLTEEVEVIIHLAATVRFEEPFKRAVLLNARGTKLLLELAKECKNLLAFAHVSTAYCHPHERVLYEKTYPPPANPDDIIKVVELLDEEVVDIMAPKLKGECPNTYTYTKALAEGLVNNEMDNLPVIILRPSVVVPILKEPLPGWTDNLNGPSGLLVAAGKGVLRTMYCNSSSYVDFLPVDIAANAIMVATYDYMNHKERRVYNLASSSIIKLTWAEVIEMGRSVIEKKMPLNWVVWYPGGTMKSSKLLHNICVVLFHYIPAIVLDSLIILSGNKPVLWRVQQRISKGFDLFEYYANNQWDFNIDGSLVARSLLNETEMEIYKIDEEGVDIEKYLYDCVHSTRLYMLKQSDESLPTARRHMKIMWAVDKICKIMILVWFGYLMLKYFMCPVLNIEF